MIEEFPNIKTLTHPDRPTILFTRRAILPCGCFIVAGSRMDNGEAAASVGACCEDHGPMVTGVYGSLLESLGDPQDRPMVDVANEMLEEAARAR